MKKLIYFSTPYCGPCRMFGPIMEQVKAQGIPVEKINPEQVPALAVAYGVRSVPTVVVVNSNGEKVDSFTGAKSLEEVVSLYKNS